MKIMIVSQYFWPENFLVNEIAEELQTRGHKVTILTGLPDYSTGKVPKKFKYLKKRHEYLNGVEIYRVPIIARRTGLIFRILNYLSFMVSSSLFALFYNRDVDVIMAYQTAPVLMGNAAIILKKKLKKPLFYYCLDIWPDQMKIWNVKENNIAYKMVKKYCQFAYNSGDVLGITSMPFKKYMMEVNKVDESKIVYLPQHSDRMVVANESNAEKETIDLIFAGNIGKQQNLECLLKAVSMISTKVKYFVHIYGNGTSFESCIELSNKLDINDKVKFYGRVSKDELKKIYPKMDAFLLTLCSEKEIGYSANTVPAKFQNYLSTGKPILASIDGGANDIISSEKCGLCVSAGDYIGFSKIIQEFIENPRKYSECGKLGKKYFDDNYDKNVVMTRLENILLSIK